MVVSIGKALVSLQLELPAGNFTTKEMKVNGTSRVTGVVEGFDAGHVSLWMHNQYINKESAKAKIPSNLNRPLNTSPTM